MFAMMHSKILLELGTVNIEASTVLVIKPDAQTMAASH